MSGAVKQAEEVGAGDDTSIFFFLSFFIFSFYVMLFILLLLIFISLLLYLFTFFMKVTFIFSCSRMFRDVLECSVFRVLSTPVKSGTRCIERFIIYLIGDHEKNNYFYRAKAVQY